MGSVQALLAGDNHGGEGHTAGSCGSVDQEGTGFNPSRVPPSPLLCSSRVPSPAGARCCGPHNPIFLYPTPALEKPLRSTAYALISVTLALEGGGSRGASEQLDIG